MTFKLAQIKQEKGGRREKFFLPLLLNQHTYIEFNQNICVLYLFVQIQKLQVIFTSHDQQNKSEYMKNINSFLV